jgi:2-oxo-4-hydroxy-4-carboxy-5-ureidoimidazoline decarboxylase
MKADDQTKLDLRKANEKYFKKFGFIFIVFATGKSGSEILKLLTDRLENTREQELRNAGEEQRRIMQLRLMNGP